MANKKAPRVGVRSSRSASIDQPGFGQGDENNPGGFVDLLPAIRKEFLDSVGDGAKVKGFADAVAKAERDLIKPLSKFERGQLREGQKRFDAKGRNGFLHSDDKADFLKLKARSNGAEASAIALADARGKLSDAQTFNKAFSQKDAATFRELASELTRARKLTGLTDKEREADIRDTTTQLRDFLNNQTKLSNDRITANTQVGSDLFGKVNLDEENTKIAGLSGFLGPLNKAFEATQARPGDVAGGVVPPGTTDPATDPTAPGTVPAGDTNIEDNPDTTGGEVQPGDTQVVIDAKIEAAKKRGRRFKTGGGLLGLLTEPETRKKALLGN